MVVNFEKKLEEATEEELRSWVNTRNPHFTVLASNELIRRELDKLHGIIKTFNDKSSAQTEKMITLTHRIVVLTIAMVIGLGVQIYLARVQTAPILFEQERSERRAYEICKSNPQGEYTGLTGAPIKCQDVFNSLKEKFE